MNDDDRIDQLADYCARSREPIFRRNTSPNLLSAWKRAFIDGFKVGYNMRMKDEKRQSEEAAA